MGTAFSVKPVTCAIGAEIHGVDLSSPMDGVIDDGIREAFHKHLVLIFRDQILSPVQHRDFAAGFFELEAHPFVQGLDGIPEIIAIVKEPDEGRNWGGPWHADVTFKAQPSIGAVLYAQEVPEFGGDTLFANMYLAYETLSDGMKQTLRTLRAVHDSGDPRLFYDDYQGMKPKPGDSEQHLHPVVRTHPVTGRHALFVNKAYTRGFEGMTEAESRPLLDYLCNHAIRPEYTCRVCWRPGTVVMWDNRVTLHHATDDDFEAQAGRRGFRRVLHRATMAGETPVCSAA